MIFLVIFFLLDCYNLGFIHLKISFAYAWSSWKWTLETHVCCFLFRVQLSVIFSYSQQWWHNETGTGTEYASFIFTITLQQIYPTFSASKIIIKIFGTFCQSTVLWTTTVSPLRRCIFAAAIFEMFAKKFANVQSAQLAPMLRCLVTDKRKIRGKNGSGLMRLGRRSRA